MGNHISIPNSTKLGGEVNQLVSQMQVAHDNAERLLHIMTETASDGDYTQLAADLGLSGVAQQVKTLIAGAYTYALNLADYTYVLSRLG